MKWRNMWKDIQKASPLLLTIIGVTGVVGTAVLTAKCTPKAMKAIEEKQKTSTEPLKPLEKAVAAAPAYLPAIGVGSLTIFAIVSSNHLSHKQNLSLAATCTLLQKNYKEYRNKVKELFGAETDKKIETEIAKDKMDLSKLQKYNGPSMDQIYIWQEPTTGQIFEATESDVLKAEYEVNRRVAKYGKCSRAEFCELLGINIPDGSENIGWDIEDLAENWDQFWIDFDNIIVEADGDMPPYRVIYSFISPDWDYIAERRLDIDMYIDENGCYAYDVR